MSERTATVSRHPPRASGTTPRHATNHLLHATGPADGIPRQAIS